tara:strand:- start:8835 stop:9113 length:279 start_codon:yes stop_codon:yes gene_type:complete
MMSNERVGRVVLQNKNGVVRYGVVTTEKIKQDGWLYYTIYWISKTSGESPWMKQIEWRHDKLHLIDEDRHLYDLQTAMQFGKSRKFTEEGNL